MSRVLPFTGKHVQFIVLPTCITLRLAVATAGQRVGQALQRCEKTGWIQETSGMLTL